MATKKRSSRRTRTPGMQRLSSAHQDGVDAWYGERVPWEGLSLRQRIGFAGGQLVFQLRGNGAALWLSNGFAGELQGRIQPLLRDLGTPSCRAVADVVDRLWEVGEEFERWEEEHGDVLFDEDDEPEVPSPPEVAEARAAFNRLEAKLGELMDTFRSLADEFVAELDAHLAAS